MNSLRVWLQLLICSLLFISGISPQCFSKNIYLSNSGSDLNAGDHPSVPLASFARPNARTFMPGDTLFLEGSSTINGNLYLSKEDGGDQANPVVITSYGTGTATINSPLFTAIYIEDTDGIVITNLELSSPQPSNLFHIGVFIYHSDPSLSNLAGFRLSQLDIHGFNIGISVGGESSIMGFKDGEISHCHVHNCQEAGIFTWAGFSQFSDGLPHNNWWIHHNLVEQIPGLADPTRHSGNGIMISRMHSSVIEYNEVRFCGANNLHCGGPVGLWAFQASNILIQYNESHHNSNGQGCDGGGFDFDGGVTNSVMQYNYSHDNDGAGFLVAQYAYAPAMENLTIRYNISENDGQEEGYGGITLWTSETGDYPTIKNVFIYNNTIYSSASTTSTAASIWNDDYINVLFLNNIFLTENNPLLEIEATEGFSFVRNSYHSYSGDFLIKDDSKSYMDLFSWMKESGAETIGNSYTGNEGDPFLTNYGTLGTVSNFTQLFSTSYYRLTDTSGLINKGISVGNLGLSPASQDFYGNPSLVGSSPDIGAFESAIKTSRLTSLQQGISYRLLTYPNPADQYLLIDIPESALTGGSVTIVVTNLMGQETDRFSGSSDIQWNTASVPSGTYQLSMIFHNKLLRSGPVVIQH